MFDLSWGEVLIVGAVALIVIGPKELPKALRTVGQMAGKLRRMASDFQGQFNDAMREAELDEIRKQVASVNDAANFNPIQTVRDELKSAIESKPAAAGGEDTVSTASATVPADPLAALPQPDLTPVGDPVTAYAAPVSVDPVPPPASEAVKTAEPVHKTESSNV
jgi:sec-independent protein translocase protein TatB